MPPCCRPADSLAAISTQAVGKLLACATQHGASCGVQVVKGVGSRGSLEPGAMAQRALRTPSPLLLRRERVRWGVAVGSAPEAIDTVVSREEAAANY